MPAGILTTRCEPFKTEVQRRKGPKRRVGGRSANPLTGFRCSCSHQWPVGGVKAAQCDRANLGPRAAKELESAGSHDTAAADEASAPVVNLN